MRDELIIKREILMRELATLTSLLSLSRGEE